MTNRDLIRKLRDGLAPGYEWTERDLVVLALAEAQAADLDELETLGDAVTTLREKRQQRIALGRLVGLVDVPDTPSTMSTHAAKAARARWAS